MPTLVVAPPISTRMQPSTDLIFRHDGLAGRIRCDDISRNRKMGALDGKREVSQMGGIGRDNAKLDTRELSPCIPRGAEMPLTSSSWYWIGARCRTVRREG